MKNNEEFIIETKHTPELGTGIYSLSKKVRSCSRAIQTAEKVKNWLNRVNGSFLGDNRLAFAISHCQVIPNTSKDSYAFFVVAEDFMKQGREDSHGKNKNNFWFPDQMIFNAEILEAPEKIERNIPKREIIPGKKIETRITVKKDLVKNKVYVPDSCMSFPNKKQKNVEVYYRIKVKYQTRGIFGLLVTHKEWCNGLKAHIFQHEVLHSKGKNIYYHTYEDSPIYN